MPFPHQEAESILLPLKPRVSLVKAMVSPVVKSQSSQGYGFSSSHVWM